MARLEGFTATCEKSFCDASQNRNVADQGFIFSDQPQKCPSASRREDSIPLRREAGFDLSKEAASQIRSGSLTRSAVRSRWKSTAGLLLRPCRRRVVTHGYKQEHAGTGGRARRVCVQFQPRARP